MLDPPLDILSEYTFSLLEIITAHDHMITEFHSFTHITLDKILDEVE